LGDAKNISLKGINPDSEVEGSLIPDSFVFLQDSSLRFRSVQNDKQVVVILSDSEESRINFGIRDYSKVSFKQKKPPDGFPPGGHQTKILNPSPRHSLSLMTFPLPQGARV
jgi:hypothetical protein